MVVAEIQSLLNPIMNALGVGGSDPECNDTGIDAHMISSYQCEVHSNHIGEDQDAELPEFVHGNSKFGVTANDLKKRMPCCNSKSVQDRIRSKMAGESGRNSFLPYCCKTTESKCPGRTSLEFAYTNDTEPFNGVCYARGSRVHEVITPVELARDDSPPPSKTERYGAMVTILAIIFVSCVLLFINLKSHWARQKRNKLRKRLIRGLENIDQVT